MHSTQCLALPVGAINASETILHLPKKWAQKNTAEQSPPNLFN
jgi:hypothetical protein